jgi:Fis family transcriptional regulator
MIDVHVYPAVRRFMTRKTVEHTLHEYIQLAVENYFENLGDQTPSNIYAMTMTEVEKAMLQTVLHQAKNNQSLAAKYLGLNRSTLRKKLKEYDLYPNL